MYSYPSHIPYGPRSQWVNKSAAVEKLVLRSYGAAVLQSKKTGAAVKEGAAVLQQKKAPPPGIASGIPQGRVPIQFFGAQHQ
jgi:hypothetical protein